MMYFTPWSMGADSQLGYSEEMRLAFLRQAGVDPVDLSMTGNNFNNAYVPYRQNWYDDSTLPFFSDYGPMASYMRRNGVRGTEMGARDSLPRWNRFREEAAQRFRGDLLREVKARVKDTVVFAAPPAKSPMDTMARWYGSVDKELTTKKETVDSPGPEAPPTQPVPEKPTDLAASAKSQSNTAYAVWTYFPYNGAKDRRTDFLSQAGWSVGGLQKGAWDGMVIDLSRVPIDTAVALLAAFNPPTPKGMETGTPAAAN
jgi:hypothetical protein